MRELFILLVSFEAIYSVKIDDPPKDINDLFPTITPDSDQSNLTYNISTTFDIRKIDLKKLMTKISSFNATLEDDMANNTRRQVLVNKLNSKYWFQKASDHMTRQKMIDMMLQVIYMARHIMKELESNSYFNVKDTGYRIGFLFKKLLTQFENVQFIYTIMYKKRAIRAQVEPHLQLHHRAVKLYTDFMYYWWVMIKVDGKHRDANQDPPKLPKRLKAEGGLSAEKEVTG